MPFVLLAIGLALVVAGIRGTYTDLGRLVSHDITGMGGAFLWWIVATGMVAVLGYSPKARPMAIALLILVVLALVLSHGQALSDLSSQLQQIANRTTPNVSNLDYASWQAEGNQASAMQTAGSGGGGSLFGSILGGVAQAGAAYMTGGASLAATAAASAASGGSGSPISGF